MTIAYGREYPDPLAPPAAELVDPFADVPPPDEPPSSDDEVAPARTSGSSSWRPLDLAAVLSPDPPLILVA